MVLILKSNADGDDGWFACIYLTSVYDVCFCFYGLKNLNYIKLLGYGLLTYRWILYVCDYGLVFDVYYVDLFTF